MTFIPRHEVRPVGGRSGTGAGSMALPIDEPSWFDEEN